MVRQGKHDYSKENRRNQKDKMVPNNVKSFYDGTHAVLLEKAGKKVVTIDDLSKCLSNMSVTRSEYTEDIHKRNDA